MGAQSAILLIIIWKMGSVPHAQATRFVMEWMWGTRKAALMDIIAIQKDNTCALANFQIAQLAKQMDQNAQVARHIIALI